MDNQLSHSDSDIEGEEVISGAASHLDLLRGVELLIHASEKEAYASVLRAFSYKTDYFNKDKQNLLTALMKEFMISNDEHKEILNEVNGDETVNSLRLWRTINKNDQPTKRCDSPCHSVSDSPEIKKTSHPNQPLLSLSSVKSVQHPFVEPVKEASLNPLIGKKVHIKCPKDDDEFYPADITDYDPEKGKHKVVYDANTLFEFCEWVDLKKILPENIRWEGIDHASIPHKDEQNGQKGNDDDTTGGIEQAHVKAISSLLDTSDENNDA